MKTRICPSTDMRAKARIGPRICCRCGKEYVPTALNQKYCAECIPAAKVASMAARHALHREEDNERSRQRSLAHLERDIEAAKHWVSEHPEQVKANKQRWEEKNCGHQSIWDAAHPGANAARSLAWRIEHPDAFAVWANKHPNEIRINRLKSDQKRCALGFEPINRPFPGCEGHHLDKDHVAYVPKPLHKSVPHNVWTGRNMERINALALAWLEQTKETV